jgi:Uma2 family endonuclease
MSEVIFMSARLVLKDREVEAPYLLRIFDVSEREFEALTDEDVKAELFDGVMIVHSPTTWRHDDVQGFLLSAMRIYAETKGLGRVTGPNTLMQLMPQRRFAPDVLFVRAERVPSPLPPELHGRADLVLEVLSPSTHQYDLNEKRRAYREGQIPEIWLVDGEAERVLVDRLDPERKRYRTRTVRRGLLESQALPGFSLQVEWLWQDPLSPLSEVLRHLGLGV